MLTTAWSPIGADATAVRGSASYWSRASGPFAEITGTESVMTQGVTHERTGETTHRIRGTGTVKRTGETTHTAFAVDRPPSTEWAWRSGDRESRRTQPGLPLIADSGWSLKRR